MKRIKLFTAALLLAAISAGNDVWALSDSGKKDTRPVESPKFFSGNANPLSDFILWPTRHRWNTTEGSMCMEPMTPSNWTVWENTAKIHTNTSHSLVMLSTDNMVNWTYHGLIDVKALSPWGIASWAPSIVSRVESDGKTYAGEPVHPRIRPLQGSFRPGCRDR